MSPVSLFKNKNYRLRHIKGVGHQLLLEHSIVRSQASANDAQRAE